MISYNQGTILVLFGFFKCFFYFYSLYIVNVVSKHVYIILIEKKKIKIAKLKNLTKSKNPSFFFLSITEQSHYSKEMKETNYQLLTEFFPECPISEYSQLASYCLRSIASTYFINQLFKYHLFASLSLLLAITGYFTRVHQLSYHDFRYVVLMPVRHFD